MVSKQKKIRKDIENEWGIIRARVLMFTVFIYDL